MGTSWTLAEGVVALDETGLTTATPASGPAPRLTLTGERPMARAGGTPEAMNADTPSLGLQVDPGQWHTGEAHLEGNLSVTPSVSTLQKPSATLVQATTGDSPSPAPWALAAAAAGALILILAAAGVVRRKLRTREHRNDDIRRTVEDIRALARALDQKAQAHSNPRPKILRDIHALVASAERLSASTLVLREQIRRKGAQPLPGGDASPLEVREQSATPRADERDDPPRQDPLAAEEQRFRERLNRIRDTLRTLADAWPPADSNESLPPEDAAAETRGENGESEMRRSKE